MERIRGVEWLAVYKNQSGYEDTIIVTAKHRDGAVMKFYEAMKELNRTGVSLVTLQPHSR